MKERTTIEHAAWLFEQLRADSYLELHTTWPEFWAEYSMGLVKDEFEEGNDISHIVADYQKLQSTTRGDPVIPPSKSEMANERAREKRHKEMLEKYPVL